MEIRKNISMSDKQLINYTLSVVEGMYHQQKEVLLALDHYQSELDNVKNGMKSGADMTAALADNLADLRDTIQSKMLNEYPVESKRKIRFREKINDE